MATASPVIVHVTNTIDWWAVVLDGVLGALVGGVISLGVAMLVVSRTHDSDRLLARERRALDCAERMMDVLTVASGAIGQIVGDYSPVANEQRRSAVMGLSRTVVTEKPAMVDQRYDPLFDDATTAFANYVTFVHDLQRRDGAIAYRFTGGSNVTEIASERIEPLDRAAFGALTDYVRISVEQFARFRRAAGPAPEIPALPSYDALRAQADAVAPHRDETGTSAEET